jgi:hypothetical protein
MMRQTESPTGRISDQITGHFFFPPDLNNPYVSEEVHVNKRRMLVKRMMKSRQIVFAGIIIVALLSSTGIVVALGNSSAAAQGLGNISITSIYGKDPFGPQSPMFGLKIAMEDLDETFTFNDTQRVEKQVDHAQTRIEEVSRELELNQGGSAEKALDLYSQKLNQTEMSLPRIQSDAAGLLHVQELIVRHQTLLADLLSRYPGSPGLARAYNNNLELEQKFGEKTRMKFERVVDKNNKTALKAVKLNTSTLNNAGWNDNASPRSTGRGRNESLDHVKDKKDEVPVTPTVAIVHLTQSVDKGTSKNQEKNGN